MNEIAMTQFGVIVLLGLPVGAVLIYTAARLVVTAYFVTKDKFNRGDYDATVRVQRASTSSNRRSGSKTGR